MKWLKRIAIVSGIVLVVVFFVLLPVGASFLITNSRFKFAERGMRRPEDVGLPVESLSFRAADGVTLRGWWNGGDGDKPVIIFLHGLNRSRLELLERAAESYKEGYGVLLFDLRNHGESDAAYTTLGIHETRDVCAASREVRSRAPGRSQILWGVSMGAATGLLSLRDCGGFAGVVSDSAFLSFRETISHHLGLFFRLPSFPISNLIVGITSFRMGMDPDDGDVERALRGSGDVPVLFIAGEKDRRMPPAIAKRLFEAAQSPRKDLVIVRGAGHGDAFSVDRKVYLDVVFRFFVIIRDDMTKRNETR
jgi:pimeloyl-ACP methyl ester carboxylesterase